MAWRLQRIETARLIGDRRSAFDRDREFLLEPRAAELGQASVRYFLIGLKPCQIERYFLELITRESQRYVSQLLSCLVIHYSHRSVSLLVLV